MIISKLGKKKILRCRKDEREELGITCCLEELEGEESFSLHDL